MRLPQWIGRVVVIRAWHKFFKPQQVQILDVEVASGVCNHYPHCGRPDDPHVWFWAKFA